MKTAKHYLWELAHTPHFAWTWVRYLFTGDCGYACDWATFYKYHSGERELIFVPECGCPVHDWKEWFF